MALGDITFWQESGSNGGRGARLYNVSAGTPILAGEPVQVKALGDTTVQPAHTSTPDQTAHLYVGIAATNSTNTTTAAGTVNVFPINSNDTWVINAAVAASWDTQSEYDALVGKRVLIQNNAEVGYAYSANVNIGTYSLLASDSANNGCVIVAADVTKLPPGKVAFAFRDGVSYLA